jgi:rubrerythrin
MAVTAEKENKAMYDRLLSVVQDPEVRSVLIRLRDASQNNHLPAFQRCQNRFY